MNNKLEYEQYLKDQQRRKKTAEYYHRQWIQEAWNTIGWLVLLGTLAIAIACFY